MSNADNKLVIEVNLPSIGTVNLDQIEIESKSLASKYRLIHEKTHNKFNVLDENMNLLSCLWFNEINILLYKPFIIVAEVETEYGKNLLLNDGSLLLTEDKCNDIYKFSYHERNSFDWVTIYYKNGYIISYVFITPNIVYVEGKIKDIIPGTTFAIIENNNIITDIVDFSSNNSVIKDYFSFPITSIIQITDLLYLINSENEYYIFNVATFETITCEKVFKGSSNSYLSASAVNFIKNDVKSSDYFLAKYSIYSPFEGHSTDSFALICVETGEVLISDIHSAKRSNIVENIIFIATKKGGYQIFDVNQKKILNSDLAFDEFDDFNKLPGSDVLVAKIRKHSGYITLVSNFIDTDGNLINKLWI